MMIEFNLGPGEGSLFNTKLIPINWLIKKCPETRNNLLIINSKNQLINDSDINKLSSIVENLTNRSVISYRLNAND